MELFIFRPPKYYELYNCSFYDLSSIPLERRQNIPLGLGFLTIGVIEWMLYIPCMASIWTHMENPCYKMMFYMGLLDMGCMLVNSIGTGILGMLGAVYCSHPDLLYVMGAFALMLWYTETIVETFLAVNRCVEICSPRWSDRLFKGFRTWLWMIPPTVYGLHLWWTAKPAIFSGLYTTYFFNPHVGYLDDIELIYRNDQCTLHNWTVSVILPITYFSFGFLLIAKVYSMGQRRGESNITAQKMIFLQVALISMVNFTAASMCIYMQYHKINPFLMIIAQFAWSQAHGIPPVIYLVMNKTIRTDSANILLKLFCGIDRSKALRAKGRSEFPVESLRRTITSGKVSALPLHAEPTPPLQQTLHPVAVPPEPYILDFLASLPEK